MYILIGADLVPTQRNTDLFVNGDLEQLIGAKLIDALGKASYRIFNLETPLTEVAAPIEKCGPNLSASPETIVGYKALGVDLLTLANNHIMDQGEKGLFSTIQTLEDSNIAYVGAGSTLQEAQKPYIFDFASKKIGVYACAEHEFSIAGEDKPGANPFDPLWSLDHVEDLKKKVDFVIVLYHGGKEHYRYPSPMLQKTCRRIVDKGADLVICQHSHCIGCEEKYKDCTIVYGQGNFIFDDNDNECWQTSLLVKLNDDFSVSYLPLKKMGIGIRHAEGQESLDIIKEFNSRSQEIKSTGFIEKRYKDFADSFLEYYLRTLAGKQPLFLRVINKLSGGSYLKRCLRKSYGRKDKVRISNYIDCEAHRELLLQALMTEVRPK